MIWVVGSLAGAVLLFLPGLLEQFETPKIELVRACGLGALAHGLIAGRAGRPARWRPLDWAVAAWLAVEILATVFSISPRVSVVGETRQREGLLTSLALAGLYFAARDAFAREPRRIRHLLDLALVLASVAGLYAVLQVMGGDPLEWRRAAAYAGEYVRPFATFGHPNLLGLFSAAAAAIGLPLALSAGGGASRWLRGSAAVLLLVVTALTLSRAAWLGAASGLGVALVLAMRERREARLSPRALAIAVAALLVGGKVQAPPGYADHVTFLRPELCQACGRKVCFEICSAEAIRPGEGGVPSFDREKCVHCGACLWSCTQRIDGTDEVNLQFRAGTGGLHSAEN